MTEAEARALFNDQREIGDLAHYGEKAAVAAILVATRISPAEHVTAACDQLVAEAVDQGNDLARAGVLERIEDRLCDMVFETAVKVRDRVLPSSVQAWF